MLISAVCQKGVKIHSLFDKQFSLFLCKHEINNSFILKINPFNISGHVNQNLRQILSEQRLPCHCCTGNSVRYFDFVNTDHKTD